MAADAVVPARSIIVADDTAFVRDRFRTALTAVGHHATTAASGAELLALVRAGAGGIDLVVLDLRLPQSRGIDLIRMLRGIEGFRAPILVFSGTIASAAEVRELAALGVAGYVNEYTGVQHIIPALAPHLLPDHANRRASPRVALGVSVVYRVGNTIAGAVTLNVSRGGIAIRSTSPPEPGTSVRVRFRLPGGRRDIDAEARVVWADRRLGMGLQFTRIDPADQAAADEFVNGHFFSNRKA